MLLAGIAPSSVPDSKAGRWAAGTSNPTSGAIRRASSAASAPGTLTGDSRRTPSSRANCEWSVTIRTWEDRLVHCAIARGRSARQGNWSRPCQ